MSIDDPNGHEQASESGSANLSERAGDDLKEVTTRAREDLDTITQHAASDARDLGHKAQEKIGEATDKAKSFAGSQKDLAASQINGVADAISKVATELAGSDQKVVGQYARDIANGLSNLGQQIESRDIDDLLGTAQDFGRTQPVAFLGLAALAGFAASRFALASNHRRDAQALPTDAGARSGGHQPKDRSTASTNGRTLGREVCDVAKR